MSLTAAIAVALHVLVELALIVRVLLRPHRQPASRIAWIVVIAVLPVFGILAYLLFGEVNIGRRRVARLRQVIGAMPAFPPAVPGDESNLEARVPERYAHLFHMGRSISGLGPVGGNTARLMADSNSAIDAMVADIDAAWQHVHVLFYIWLPDGNGCRVVEALRRAAGRGVTCRAMADDLGSRIIFRNSRSLDHLCFFQTAACLAGVAQHLDPEPRAPHEVLPATGCLGLAQTAPGSAPIAEELDPALGHTSPARCHGHPRLGRPLLGFFHGRPLGYRPTVNFMTRQLKAGSQSVH